MLLEPQVHEKSTNVIRNFNIFFRYKSKSGIHNMSKEFRDTTTRGAVAQLCNFLLTLKMKG